MRRTSQRGSASIEFLGLLPLLLAVTLAIVQACLVGATVSAADSAARAAARATSEGNDPAAAGHAAVPGWLDGATAVSADAGTGASKVSIEVPVLLPALHLGSFTVVRSAVLPRGKD
jgi:Flp pilus assembly protein TadG